MFKMVQLQWHLILASNTDYSLIRLKLLSAFCDLIIRLHRVPAAVKHYGWQDAQTLPGFMLNSKLVHHRSWTDFMVAHILN